MQQAQDLAAILSREIDCMQRLLDVLKKEYTALINTDVGNLEQATTVKNAALAEQAELSKLRGQFLTSASYSDSLEGLQSFIADCAPSQELETALVSLTALAQQCQINNRENGRLILQKQEQTRGALSVLRQTEQSSTIYSGQGIADVTDSSRTLGKA